MPAKNQTSAPATKPAAAEGKTKTKASAKQKVPAPSHTIMTLEEKKAPKYLDRLYIPGMSENVKGYDAGVPKWLFESGMTIQVDKGWAAAPAMSSPSVNYSTTALCRYSPPSSSNLARS